MSSLISKVQYKSFETGEFIQEAERSYEATIQLITDFPWEEQRDHLQVSLTCPSVTIDQGNGSFLKLALYYNGKFALHFCNQKDELYTKSFTSLQDCFPFIQSCFQTNDFDIKEFKKETTWFMENRVHFISQDFRYQVTAKRAKQYIWSTSNSSFMLTAFIIGFLIFKHADQTAFIISLFVIFVMGGGINLLLFWNFYSYAKSKTIVISKGNDTFFFGETDALKKYNKNDIKIFTVVRLKKSNSRANPFDGFSIMIIELNSGEKLKIPNLLVDLDAMRIKLSDFNPHEIVNLPFLRDYEAPTLI